MTASLVAICSCNPQVNIKDRAPYRHLQPHYPPSFPLLLTRTLASGRLPRCIPTFQVSLCQSCRSSVWGHVMGLFMCFSPTARATRETIPRIPRIVSHPVKNCSSFRYNVLMYMLALVTTPIRLRGDGDVGPVLGATNPALLCGLKAAVAKETALADPGSILSFSWKSGGLEGVRSLVWSPVLYTRRVY